MSRNDVLIMPISERAPALFSCKAGCVPCKTMERKHAASKSPRKMLPEYLYRRDPTRCATTPPSGWYYNSHQQEACIVRALLNYKGEERWLAKEWQQ